MIAIILAGGRSTRLHPLTKSVQKFLLPIGDTTLLRNSLGILDSVGVTKLIFVTGFNADGVRSEVENTPLLHSTATFVHNDAFETTTPLQGFALVEPHIDDDFLLLNADIYFSREILEKTLAHSGSVIAVDSSASYCENEMFVNHSDNFEVEEISKRLTHRERGQSKSVQIAKFDYADKDVLFSRVRELARRGDALYPANAYDALIAKHRFYAVDIAGEFWQELDTRGDLVDLHERLGIPYGLD